MVNFYRLLNMKVIIYLINFFEKLCIILLIICHAFYAQSLITKSKDSIPICGLSEKKVQEALSYSPNNLVKGIAVDSKCLNEKLASDDQCLFDQKKLIACLQKESSLINEETANEENEESECSNDKDSGKNKYQETMIRLREQIIKANKEMNRAAKDYEEIAMKHLQSIDDLSKKISRLDQLSNSLINAKFELTKIIQQNAFDNYVKIPDRH